MVTHPALIVATLALLPLLWYAAQDGGGWSLYLDSRGQDEPDREADEHDELYDDDLWRGP